MNTIPNMVPFSWRDERMPEMLWAVLLVGRAERDLAIHTIRETGHWCAERRDALKLFDGSHTAITRLPGEEARSFVQRVIDASSREVYRPLLLLPNLPGYEIWHRAIGDVPDLSDWKVWQSVIVSHYDHQSEQATMCRWVRVLLFMLAGSLKLPHEEAVREILEYPFYGDLRRVRPLIRASEIAIPLGGADHRLSPGQARSPWGGQFWKDVFDVSTPRPGSFGQSPVAMLPPAQIAAFRALRRSIEQHHDATRVSSVDVKHDVVFGLVLAPVRVATDILESSLHQSVLSVFALRYLTECVITLGHLLKSNDPAIWTRYRAHGHGQAKLLCMKFERDGLQASSIDLAYVDAFVNEDKSEMYVNVELGDWDKSSVRDRAVNSGQKEIYDTFYDYASNITHSSWAGVAPIAFTHDMNPLRRLQRVPRTEPMRLPSSVQDMERLIKILCEMLEGAYPGMPSL